MAESAASNERATIGRFIGGPLDSQVLPLQANAGDEIVYPYGEAQVVYHRIGDVSNTGPSDGAATATYKFVGTTGDLGAQDQI